jgi:hypothetical protein
MLDEFDKAGAFLDFFDPSWASLMGVNAKFEEFWHSDFRDFCLEFFELFLRGVIILEGKFHSFGMDEDVLEWLFDFRDE